MLDIRTINTDEFGEKMWRNPGADTADFFNYGLDEKQWEAYCKQMASIILSISLYYLRKIISNGFCHCPFASMHLYMSPVHDQIKQMRIPWRCLSN